MSTPILATKLFMPPPRPKVVSRLHLIAQLNEGLARKLTLVSAPAGFGKTTLISEWLAAAEGLQKGAVAWLSLDEGDSDPTRFLAYFIAALQTIVPHLGDAALALLHAAQPSPTESVLTTLLNEIATLPHKVVLVLDDYHVIESAPIDQAITFLLDHLPPVLHLVITTREDPPLPLARYRVRGQLSEMRARDLRFSAAEAAEFLNRTMGLKLAAHEVAALENHTEGWIAGLQLAALSMQGHHDVSGFVAAFAGDHRYIVDYLVEEVLQRQPEMVRRFLLQTSILERLCGSLCDGVTGQSESHVRLEALERGNFFVVPLDDKRQWYRYHHLFADVLAAHLRAEQPALVPLLHQRASAWYAQHAMLDDAVRHALAAEDFDRAAALIEPAIPALGRNREGSKMLSWLKVLPDDVVRRRPVLCVGYAWALMAGGELEAIEGRLQDAEHWLETIAQTGARPAGMVVVDETEFRRLPARIAIYRAGRAQLLGHVPDTVNYARRALELTTDDDALGRGAATALLGLATWTGGDLETAHRTYAEGMARVREAGNISDVISSTIALADIRLAQGRLADAQSTYEQTLQWATRPGEPILKGTADLYIGISELQREQNKLDAAMRSLAQSQELSERSGLPYNRYRWCTAMARIQEAQGDWEGALALLDEAERLYGRDFFPNVRPVAALRARVRLSQGRVDDALGWAREHGLSTADDLSYLAEFDHITLARVALARAPRVGAEIRDVIAFLERLLHAARAGGRKGSEIEILMLQALAHRQQGELPAALARLQRALTLAEPEGYVRVFVDEGSPMAHLLQNAARQGIAARYVAQLLAALHTDAEGEPFTADGRVQPIQRAAAPLVHSLIEPQIERQIEPQIEPLSERELEVLRLFATELSGPEIADHLVIALSTVRTHTKSIYSKLQVNSRRAAVRRAEELRLI